MKNTKKGISLIVLVITIIVMIILATAIILSINNSGIIGKANKAKTDSDRANLKEYVTVLEAEWEFMDISERANSGVSSSTEYVNVKLAEKYSDVALSADGELYVGLNDIAKDAIVKGIQIGNRVAYTVTSKTKSSKSTENGFQDQEIANKTDFTWKYVGVNDNGELLIVPEMTKNGQTIPVLILYGNEGYKYGIDELDRLCDVLYSTGKGTARSINMDDITKILGYTGPKGSYFDTSNIYTTTLEPQKIKDLEKEIGQQIYYRYNTPDGREFSECKSDYHLIKKDDVTYKDRWDLIFYESNEYWIATRYLMVSFRMTPDFSICLSDRYDGIYNSRQNYSFSNTMVGNGSGYGGPFCLRPIVTLTSKLTKGTDAKGEIWQFE